jgi:DNA-binding FadR family transcriptional regulator
MPVRSVSRGGLVDQALVQMRELITSGEWPVGERIPPEPVLASALGVGRSTVREAVRALVHAGLLAVRQGDGTRVQASNEMSAVLRQQVQAAERRHILEVRRALDVEAARLAARRRTPHDLAELDQALARRESAWADGDPDTWVQADAAFHLGIVAAAHNPVLARLYDGFTDALRASIAASVAAGLTEETHIDHTALLEAIRRRDAAAAAAAASGVLAQVSAATDRSSRQADARCHSGTSECETAPGAHTSGG